MTDYKKIWSERATKIFKGKVIDEVCYLEAEDVEAMGWNCAAPVIFFTDGTYIIASCDDEGNDAGALLTSEEEMHCIPVIS